MHIKKTELLTEMSIHNFVSLNDTFEKVCIVIFALLAVYVCLSFI